ncbi:MAG TPA: DUF4367 domain-containing protein [Candidatus Saccharimonadales bacterium]|nr:DUF4367 domain-containing protein [Candidatus Saccharimonadales bacterium]
MSSAKSIIEINGLKYDASTGEVISGGRHKPKVISDMISNAKSHKTHSPAHHITSAKPKKLRHHTPAGSLARKPQKSHTLMRPAVKRPNIKSEAERLSGDTQKRQILLHPNKERAKRAKNVPKSPQIKKFSFAQRVKRSIEPTLQHLEVKKPKQNIPPPRPKESKRHDDWPVIDRFEQAMQEASSHLETFVEEKTRSKKSRKLAFAFATLSVLAIVSFGAYQALPMVKVKLASNKAGFSADLPAYSPAGFTLADPVHADYGQVTLSYKSRTDDKGFDITQSPSQWNSEALVSNFLQRSDKQYQTVKGNGQTIYTYDKSDATWVDGGVWYRLEGNADLSQDQLLKIANGL